MREDPLPSRWRVRCAVAVAVAVLAAGGAWWTHRLRTEAEARARERFGRIAAAVSEFETAALGSGLTDEGRRQLARHPLGLIEAEDEQPDHAGLAAAWRGRVRELLGDDPGARADYDRACELAARQAIARYLRGLHRVGEYAATRGLPTIAEPLPPESDGERALREGALADLAAAARAGGTISFGEEDRKLAGAIALVWREGARGAPAVLALLEGDAAPRAFQLRGLALHLLGRRPEAIEALEAACAAWPRDGLNSLYLAWARLARAGAGDFEGVVADASRARELLPRACQPRIAGARARLALAAWSEAAEDFGEALALHPQCVSAAHGRALAFSALARQPGVPSADLLEKALADLDAALALAPGFGPARNERIVVLMSQADAVRDRNGDARVAYRRVIAEASAVLFADPDAISVLLHRAAAHVALGRIEDAAGEDGRADYAQAVSDYGAALAQAAEPAEARLLRGAALLLQGDAETRRGLDPRESYRRAVEEYAEAVSLRPKDAAPWAARAQASTRLGDAFRLRGEDASRPYADAESDLRAGIERGDRRAWCELGSLYRSMGRPEDAVVAFERGAREVPSVLPLAAARIAEIRAAFEGAERPWARECALARLALADRDPATAHARYEAAFALLEALPADQRAFDLSEPRLRVQLAEAHYAVAGILARRASGTLPPASSGEAPDDLRNQAFRELAEAAAFGFADGARARADEALAALRDDPRFDEWLAGLR